MGFSDANLHRDEQIVLDLHPHWVMLAKGIAILVVTVLVGGWLLWFADLNDGALKNVVTFVASIAIVASLLYTLQRWVSWISTNFVVTTDRCIYRSGIFAKSGIEIPLDRINTIFFNQGVIDRLIGAGTLTIESASEKGEQVFNNVRDPVAVQQVLYQQMEDNENRKFDRVRGPVQQVSVADELAKLVALHEQGHLSDAEFEAQRTQLLGGSGQA